MRDIRENWREAVSSFGRTAILTVILIVIFELLLRAAISKASIGPFEISDLSLIRIAIPVAVAYNFYDLASLTYYILAFDTLYGNLMRVHYPLLAATRLDYFLSPRSPSLTGSDLFGHVSPNKTFIGRVSDYLGLSVVVGFVAFEIYAYYVQFTRFDVRLML